MLVVLVAGPALLLQARDSALGDPVVAAGAVAVVAALLALAFLHFEQVVWKEILNKKNTPKSNQSFC